MFFKIVLFFFFVPKKNKSHTALEWHKKRMTDFHFWVNNAFKITVQARELAPEKALKSDEASFFSSTFWDIPRILTATMESIWQQQCCEFAYSGQQPCFLFTNAFRPSWLAGKPEREPNTSPYFTELAGNSRNCFCTSTHNHDTRVKDKVNKLTGVPGILHKLMHSHMTLSKEMRACCWTKCVTVSFVLLSVFQHILSCRLLKPFLSQSVDVNVANS